MKVSEDIKQEIRDRSDIVELVSEYLHLKHSGAAYKALCPFHDEKTPSFLVNPNLQIFKCFGCGQGGDVFGFLMAMENLTFPEALKRLAQRANIELKADEDSSERELLYRIHKMAAIYYHRMLLKSNTGAPARDYLERRGIPREVWKKYQLGYAPIGWKHFLRVARSKKLANQILVDSGLIIRNKAGRFYDRFRDRIMFPIRDTGGRVVAFGGRILGQGEPKYLNSPETGIFHKSTTLYGYDAARMNIRKRETAVVVEGYTDVISCHEYGVNYAVAAMGTSLTPPQLKRLQNMARQVVLVFDGDEAGRLAAERAQDLVGRGTLRGVKVIVLPDGEDPDSYLKKHGKERFEDLVDNSIPLLEYLLERKMKDQDINSPEGKAQVIKDIAPILFREGDPVIREEYVEQVIERLRSLEATTFPEKAFRDGLRRYFRQLDHPSARGRDPIETFKEADTLYEKAEKYILSIIMSHPNLVENVFPALDLDDFAHPVCRGLAARIHKHFSQGETHNWHELIDDEDQNVVDISTRLLILSGTLEPVEEVLADSVASLKKRRLQQEEQKLEGKIQQCEREGNLEKSIELRKKLQTLLEQQHGLVRQE